MFDAAEKPCTSSNWGVPIRQVGGKPDGGRVSGNFKGLNSNKPATEMRSALHNEVLKHTPQIKNSKTKGVDD